MTSPRENDAQREPSTKDRGEAGRHTRWALIPIFMVSAAGFVLFVGEQHLIGLAILGLALGVSAVLNTRLLRDVSLVALGLTVMSFVPVTTDISWEHMVVMGAAMIVAVAAPYALSRFVYRDHSVRFPIATGTPWSTGEKWYLPIVLVLGYLILPFYLIRSGVFENWPAAENGDEVFRLFLGTNALGIWDELFFICIAFTVFRRHLPLWQANLLQAVLFTSFLYELGFRSWGPLVIFPFAIIQGLIFSRTKSLSYVITVHLLFDFVLFLVLIHAHNRSFLPIFLY